MTSARLRPVLVTGSHRSGTTWVGCTIAQAPNVGYISEPFSRLCRPGVFAAPTRQWFPYITEDTTGELTHRARRMLGFQYGYTAELRALRRPKDVVRMARDARRWRSLRASRARPLLKDPIALLSAPWLARTFDTQVLVLIRHPAAFASSLKRLGWSHPFEDFDQPGLLDGPLAPFADDIAAFAKTPRPVVEQAALLWSALYHVVSRYRDQYPSWTFVRHEDLSRAPAQQFRALFDRLELPFDDRIDAYLDAHTASGNPVEAPSDRAHQLRRDSEASIRNWRTRLTPEEIVLVRERTAGVAERFYSDGDW